MATSIRTAETDCWEGRCWALGRQAETQQQARMRSLEVSSMSQSIYRWLWPTTVEYVLLIETIITKIESILSHRIYLTTLRGRSYAGLLLV